MWGGVISENIINDIKNGSYICGSNTIDIEDLKNNYKISINDSEKRKALYKSGNNLYLIEKGKAPIGRHIFIE